MKQYLKENNIDLIPATSGSHLSIGIVERSHREVKESIKLQIQQKMLKDFNYLING